MKISSKDFRVREGDDVDLGKWPTIVDPVYKSKEQYHELLTDHVTRLSSQQQLLYASNRLRHPAGVSGHGCGRQRRRDQARHIRGQSARLPGVQLQASERHRAAARFPMAHDPIFQVLFQVEERGKRERSSL
jgi:hypothetical protein